MPTPRFIYSYIYIYMYILIDMFLHACITHTDKDVYTHTYYIHAYIQTQCMHDFLNKNVISIVLHINTKAKVQTLQYNTNIICLNIYAHTHKYMHKYIYVHIYIG